MIPLEPAEILNLEGVACPQNSARALFKLEGMGVGEILEIIVDNGEPIKNVPLSLEGEGHEIVSKVKADGLWKIRVKRG